jgi:hypothetical protein
MKDARTNSVHLPPFMPVYSWTFVDPSQNQWKGTVSTGQELYAGRKNAMYFQMVTHYCTSSEDNIYHCNVHLHYTWSALGLQEPWWIRIR